MKNGKFDLGWLNLYDRFTFDIMIYSKISNNLELPPLKSILVKEIDDRNWKRMLEKFNQTSNTKINTGLSDLDEFFETDRFPIIVSLPSNMSNIIKIRKKDNGTK